MSDRCERCSTEFFRSKSTKRFCSEKCRKTQEKLRSSERRGSPAKKTVYLFDCVECSKAVVAIGAGQRPLPPFCAECRKKLNARKRFNAWRQKNPERATEVIRAASARASRKRRASVKCRISESLSTQIRRDLRGDKQGSSWEAIVGFSADDLCRHLERQFKRGMCWQNYGAWHIDHIRPVCGFNFSSADDPAFKECWSLTNLQPLWSQQNLSKGGRRTHLI